MIFSQEYYTNPQKIPDFISQIITEIDDMDPKLTQSISYIDQFEYDPTRNAMHISFNPVRISDVNIFDKRRVTNKLLKLQSLEQDLFAQHSSRYDRDILTIETKKVANKYFI